MNIKAAFAAILVGLSISASAQDIPSKYEVVPLGEMNRASGMNDNGIVIGHVKGGSKSPDKPALWQNGKLTEFTLPKGMKEVNVNFINSENTVVGWASNFRQIRPFIWKDNSYTWIPMGSAIRMTPIGINKNGVVVGVFSGNINEQRAFVFDGKVKDIGNLGAPIANATRINDNGLVIGWSRISNSTTVAHGFKYEDGKMTSLTPGSKFSSWAYGLNNGGDIVGAMDTDTKRRAVLWSGGKTTFLTSDFGIARGVNVNKVVVGTMEIPFEQTIEGEVFRTSTLTPFVWANGVLVDLNKRIDPKSGWTLGQGLAINDKGEVLALGTKDGKQQAVLLKPIL